ncbi:hypothetical protein KJ853_00015 [Patescibacteria group bacterium]|nr:hypothetical protein [Patescibacteria group bacterium]
MEDSSINPQPVQLVAPTQPAQPVQPIGAIEEKTEILAEITSKRKDFLTGLFFGLVGAAVLALLDLLFIAMANPAQEVLISFLIFLGPLVILGLYIFFAIYYFKRRRNIFWGLLASFFVFIILAIFAVKII